jgi:hypothetical protein
MAVKTLRRIPQGSIHINPAPTQASLGILRGGLTDIGARVASALATRKSADGGPLSIGERVQEFIARNAPNITIDPTFVFDTLKKMKTPIIAALGIAAVAGLVYLSYRLYKHFTAPKANEAANTMMADLHNLAPDVFAIDGWEAAVRSRVEAAVNAGPEGMVEQLAQIKAELQEMQHKTKPEALGAGINMFKHGCSQRKVKVGVRVKVKARGKRSKGHAGAGMVCA